MPFQIIDKNGNLKETIGVLLAANFPALTGNVTTVAGSLATTVVGASGLFNISGASAGQIAFPATQNPSSDANTLDDYEEGSWTPVIGGTTSESGQSYVGGAQAGFYVKVGRFVYANFLVETSTKGTIVGSITIKGFPFSSANISLNRSVGPLIFLLLNTNWVYINLSMTNNSATAEVNGATAAGLGNNTPLTTADLTNTTYFNGSICYQTAT